MKIHTTKSGETIATIANQYEVSEETIRRINALDDGEPAAGEELLIQIPTRSYTAVYGDTVDRIAIRFGIRKNDLYRLNPWIIEKELKAGQKLTLKTGDRKKGMAVANGYFYQGCTEEKLMRAMPFLTYVSFAAAKADKRGIHKIFDCKRWVDICIQNSKIPLVRVFDGYSSRYDTESDLTEFAKELITLTEDGGFKGIVLDACSLSNSAENFSRFLMILRKMMIGCDLILITEINEKSPVEFSEYSDGSILYYPKYAMDTPLSFEEGERRIIGDLACNGESAKVFIDLPSLAIGNNGYMTTDEALNNARKKGLEINTNKSTLLSEFNSRKQGDYRYTSLSGIAALLELVNEFDYSGISFDIMRTPLSHLMMYDSAFKTSYTTFVRSREGCSRADGE